MLVGGGKNFAQERRQNEELGNWIERHKLGSPTDASVYWIHYRPSEISQLFYAESGYRVSHGLIKRKLISMGFKYRKLQKSTATGVCEDRNAQFGVICHIILVMSLESPIISIDCKKKEQLGNLYREGKCDMQGAVAVYDGY